MTLEVRILLVLHLLDRTVWTSQYLFDVGNEFTAGRVNPEVDVSLISAGGVDCVDSVVDSRINLWNFESVRIRWFRSSFCIRV